MSPRLLGEGQGEGCLRRVDRRERVHFRRVDPDYLEVFDAVVFRAVIIPAKGELHLAADTRRQRPFQLLQRRYPELGKVAFRHRQRGRRQPNVMPELPALVVALQDAEGQLVPGRALRLAGEQFPADDPGDILARRQRCKVFGGLSFTPCTG